ncbi:MAG: aldehyde dehydrogenase family protein [Candidatus Nanopelagicales bacterium]|nr:aldehyde dehydrogenase family protein [Candidatus Nanopelagicales bacterium]MCF8536760.1 aldehyde dehydrogenase family protein [Candidatus Nanopelagicales bacterium]MCF8542222.1 aldehyde dehydrogenase family protein [Candidatus Nanopelagicales bacterium]MCF8557560.1 aldehyde dehydrogenase family protein [Candidatus Nanopelagicales bacterium]
MTHDRIGVRKTHKLFIGGAFPRSESGRTYEVATATGDFWSNASKASRKDARNAVIAARTGFGKWSAATAYNRGQVLYRIAEVMEDRRAQFIDEVMAGEGVDEAAARQQVDAAIDRWVWYAGWTDKIAQALGTANPVAGPYFNFSIPEPSGVVACVAPQASSLLGLVSVIAPVIASGNSVVAMASTERPIPAITLAEVMATSDVPAGVVNLLTGDPAEILPWLASHADVNAVDLTGVTDRDLAISAEREAAGTIKRVLRPAPEADWNADPGMDRLRTFVEIKTVWHPMGL